MNFLDGACHVLWQAGRWRSYGYDQLLERDKLNLDIFWIRDDSLTDTANLPDPDIIAQDTVDDAIPALFENRFQIRYDIRYKGDDILDMSPGKRGLVLLQLILHISNATHPILIDQPEDNLDNRTISRELRSFIKRKKLRRQYS